MMLMENKRVELFRALVGSHNYNLNTEESDKDYKVFVAPTFDDLYFGKQYSISVITETVDLDYHDIRKLSSLFFKSNVNFMEVLFSNDIQISEDITFDSQFLLKEMFSCKEKIANINLSYLYSACIGMFYNKIKYLEKGTSGTQHLVDKYGYDTKQAMHSYRILDFLRRYADNNFTNFKGAIEYKNSAKEYLLLIKNGGFSLEEVKAILDKTFIDVEENYRNIYRSKEPDLELKEELDSTIKEIVRNELR